MKANQQRSGKETKKQAHGTAFEVPGLLQTTKTSKQQENEQQRNLLLLIPETRTRQLPRALRHETHPCSLGTLARACPSSRL
jgi:hypothetical protein